MEQGRELAEAAERIGALGIHRRDDGTAVVIVPRRDTDRSPDALGFLDDGADRPPAVVRLSRFTSAEIADVVAILSTHETTAEIRRLGCAFSYDASVDAIVVVTPAPASEMHRLTDLLGGRAHFRYGEVRRGGPPDRHLQK